MRKIKWKNQIKIMNIKSNGEIVLCGELYLLVVFIFGVGLLNWLVICLFIYFEYIGKASLVKVNRLT
jgi:hypothetical protein